MSGIGRSIGRGLRRIIGGGLGLTGLLGFGESQEIPDISVAEDSSVEDATEDARGRQRRRRRAEEQRRGINSLLFGTRDSDPTKLG